MNIAEFKIDDAVSIYMNKKKLFRIWFTVANNRLKVVLVTDIILMTETWLNDHKAPKNQI